MLHSPLTHLVLLDPAGDLKPGCPLCPPEGDAGTGMAATKGSITINNAADGQEYKIYKILDASVNASGGIDYDIDKSVNNNIVNEKSDGRRLPRGFEDYDDNIDLQDSSEFSV